MFTYKATNTSNGRFYIGSTLSLDKRKKQHLASNANYPFQNALRKHPDDFIWEYTEDECDEPLLEQALLDMWFGKEQCYNLCPFAKRPQVNVESARAWGILNGPTAGKRTYENKVGIFDTDAPKSEWSSLGGEVAGNRSFVEKTGLFAPGSVTFESCSKGGETGGKKGGLSTSSQRWRCLQTGHISTPGALTNYQRKRGISTSLRERVQ